MSTPAAASKLFVPRTSTRTYRCVGSAGLRRADSSAARDDSAVDRGKGSARPGRHRHGQDGGIRIADAAAHQRGKAPHAPDRGIDSRADARAGDAGGRGGSQVLQGRSAVGAAGVRRSADARADSRARARSADRRGDAGSRARSHSAGNAEARRASRARPRRSGRNARHGVRRGSRRDSRSDAGDRDRRRSSRRRCRRAFCRLRRGT